jgi:hypothetical protein
MEISDAKIERFRKRLKDEFGDELSFGDAKSRYLKILNLFWILSHKAPEPGEAPYDPPDSPWA